MPGWVGVGRISVGWVEGGFAGYWSFTLDRKLSASSAHKQWPPGDAYVWCVGVAAHPATCISWAVIKRLSCCSLKREHRCSFNFCKCASLIENYLHSAERGRMSRLFFSCVYSLSSTFHLLREEILNLSVVLTPAGGLDTGKPSV